MKIKPERVRIRLELIRLVENFRNVTIACRTLGISRNSYYRIRKLYEEGGASALTEVIRKKSIPMETVESEILKHVSMVPHLGKYRIAKNLLEKGINVSATTVNSVLRKHGLNTMEKRRSSLIDGM